MTSTPDPHRPQDPAETMAETEIRRVEEPARLLRMSTMVGALLDEAREVPLDEHAREQLQHIQAQAVREIGDSVSPELREELERLLPEPSARASQSEIRITQSQLVGWLTGVFQGIKTGLALQQATRGEPGPPPPPVSGTGPYM